MKELTYNDQVLLASLMTDGLLERTLSTIQQQLALEIIETSQDEHQKREELYNLTKAIEALKGKLQECVNDTIQEND